MRCRKNNNNSGREAYSSKSHWHDFLYIGKIRFVIKKGITERKKLVIPQSLFYSMTRINQGYITRRRRTKMRLFASSFLGAHSRLTRTITQ